MAPVASGTIAITGATGFIGSHACAAALDAGYSVRAIVRDDKDEEKLAHLRALAGAAERLTVCTGSLDKEGSYDAAFDGADAVIHTAAVVEIGTVKDPQKQIIDPAVVGTKNVLASADKVSSVKRFVHASSCIAAMQWDGPPDATMDETCWNTASTADSGDYYGFAKTESEKIAHGHKADHYDLVVVNPGVSLGPCLTKAHTKGSSAVVRQLLYGNSQNEYFAGFVDVRDVALGMVKAASLDVPADDCRRFLLVSDSQMMISGLEGPLRKLFPDYRIDANPYPGAVLGALIRVPLLWRAAVLPYQKAIIENQLRYNNSRSKNLLGIQYRSLDDTLTDTVKSMVDTGFIKPRTKK